MDLGYIRVSQVHKTASLLPHLLSFCLTSPSLLSPFSIRYPPTSVPQVLEPTPTTPLNSLVTMTTYYRASNHAKFTRSFTPFAAKNIFAFDVVPTVEEDDDFNVVLDTSAGSTNMYADYAAMNMNSVFYCSALVELTSKYATEVRAPITCTVQTRTSVLDLASPTSKTVTSWMDDADDFGIAALFIGSAVTKEDIFTLDWSLGVYDLTPVASVWYDSDDGFDDMASDDEDNTPDWLDIFSDDETMGIESLFPDKVSNQLVIFKTPVTRMNVTMPKIKKPPLLCDEVHYCADCGGFCRFELISSRFMNEPVKTPLTPEPECLVDDCTLDGVISEVSGYSTDSDSDATKVDEIIDNKAKTTTTNKWLVLL